MKGRLSPTKMRRMAHEALERAGRFRGHVATWMSLARSARSRGDADGVCECVRNARSAQRSALLDRRTAASLVRVANVVRP